MQLGININPKNDGNTEIFLVISDMEQRMACSTLTKEQRLVLNNIQVTAGNEKADPNERAKANLELLLMLVGGLLKITDFGDISVIELSGKHKR